MNYEEMDPRVIAPSPWNANVVSQENEEKLRASISRHGMFKPLLVRILPGQEPVFECIGGWHRCEQAIELGLEVVPVINLGQISDEQAKEISLADNARYGIDDTFKLSEILADLNGRELENILPWTNKDIASITSSLSADIDDLDLDQPIIVEQEDEEEDQPVEPKPTKTHQVLRFRCSITAAAQISEKLRKVMIDEGFNQEDDLTNAGDALGFVILGGGSAK